MKSTYCKTKIFCIKLVNYWDKYTIPYLYVRPFAWRWTPGFETCRRHELKHWFRKGAFCWFILYNCIVIYLRTLLKKGTNYVSDKHFREKYGWQRWKYRIMLQSTQEILTKEPPIGKTFFLLLLFLFFFSSFFFFFFLGPVILCTECTAALRLLCSPNISFSTDSITLRLVWRGKGLLLRPCLCLLV